MAGGTFRITKLNSAGSNLLTLDFVVGVIMLELGVNWGAPETWLGIVFHELGQPEINSMLIKRKLFTLPPLYLGISSERQVSGIVNRQ